MRFASTRSAAAPGTAQDARTRPVANHTAPVRTGSCAAVERVARAGESLGWAGVSLARACVPPASAGVPRLTGHLFLASRCETANQVLEEIFARHRV